MSLYILTALAMLAFAANSIFCRLALGGGAIDAASFTCIRLLSGAIMLVIILLYRHLDFRRFRLNIISAFMLFSYAICFSFAYLELSTGTGALILFGTVQLTMILFGLWHGERPGKLAWLGIACAFGGLVYLLMPSVSAPPLAAALLMIVAGIAWGIYTIRGKAIQAPLANTGWNFIGTLPLVALTYLLFHGETHTTPQGIGLAILSGALASSIGYAIWYRVLPRLTRTNAATVQLSVPVIAAIGGLVLVAEAISLRLLIASVVVLGGIYLTIRSAAGTPQRKEPRQQEGAGR
jgi:drug/metabolite transporter (DMT)-like permease